MSYPYQETCITLVATETPVFYLDPKSQDTDMKPVSRQYREGEHLTLSGRQYPSTTQWHRSLLDSPIGQMIRTAVESGNIDYTGFSRIKAEVVIDYCDGDQELIEKFEVGYFKHVVCGKGK